MTEYAGFFSRFLALLIDFVAMAVLAVIVGVIIGGCVALTIGAQSDFVAFLSSMVACLLWIILAAFQFFYFGYFWSKDGQSVGMKLVNIKVIRRSETESLSFWRAAFRGSLGYYISGLVFGLGFIWALFDSNKETWHDKLFDTWVVKA